MAPQFIVGDFRRDRRIESRHLRSVSAPLNKMEDRPSSPFAEKARHGLLVVAFVLSLIGMLRLVSVPPQALVRDVIIDDAFYYIVPAQHLLAGQGYSFDGEMRTNGVQPLWAAIVVALQATLPNNHAIVYAVVLLSGLLWMGAGAMLYRELSKIDPWFALVVVTGWLMTGFWRRTAFLGMENGLNAFLLAWIISFGLCSLRPPSNSVAQFDGRGFYLKLGLLLALLALSRVDGALLALLMGIAVLLGLVRPGGAGRPRWNWPGAMWLALPGLVLFGGALLASRLYFGIAAPISGYVKWFYQMSRPPLHGGPLAELHWHLKFLWEMSTWAIGGHLESTLWWLTGFLWPIWRTTRILRVMLGLGMGFGALQIWRKRRAISWRLTSSGSLAVVVAAFVVIHFCVYTFAMSHFTGWGTWYFPAEVMGLWVLYGIGISLFGGLISAVLRYCWPTTGFSKGFCASHSVAGAVAGLMLLVGARPICATPAPDLQHAAFYAGAQWMQRHLPAGQKTGAFSSGIVAYFDPQHEVVNLDGLMNNTQYFENYLKAGRIPQYIRDRGITYFADYAESSRWRSGHFWSLDLNNMHLLDWWPMGLDRSYGIWKFLPEGTRCDVLDPCEGPHNRISQIQYAAFIQNRFHTVPEEQLDAALRQPTFRGCAVVTSIVDPLTQRALHVLATPAQIRALGITRDNCGCQTAVNAIFGRTIDYLGFDLPNRKLSSDRRMIISQYWCLADGARPSGKCRAELALAARSGALQDEPLRPAVILHSSPFAYGTRPSSSWKPDEVVTETYSFPIPSGIKPGWYPLVLTLRDGGGHPLPITSQHAQPTACFLANVLIQ